MQKYVTINILNYYNGVSDQVLDKTMPKIGHRLSSPPKKFKNSFRENYIKILDNMVIKNDLEYIKGFTLTFRDKINNINYDRYKIRKLSLLVENTLKNYVKK